MNAAAGEAFVKLPTMEMPHIELLGGFTSNIPGALPSLSSLPSFEDIDPTRGLADIASMAAAATSRGGVCVST